MLLQQSVIERFTAHAPGLTGVTRRTLRTNLRFIARAAVPALAPGTCCCPGSAPGPRTARPRDGYLALADAQPTIARRMRAAGLVCLGAGAGLIRADLRHAGGTDICCRSGGLIVTVPRHPGRALCRCWPATTSRCWNQRKFARAPRSPAAPIPPAVTSRTR